MTNYFLLNHKNKKIVSQNIEPLLKKADEIVSSSVIEQSMITGPSYHYEKVCKQDGTEYKYFIISRNTNSLSFHQQEDLVCNIEEVPFLHEEKQDPEKSDENNTDDVKNDEKELNEKENIIDEMESFEDIEINSVSENKNK